MLHFEIESLHEVCLLVSLIMSRIKSKKGQKSENLQQVNLLQAVVVADSFDSRFQPISDDLPRVNKPLKITYRKIYDRKYIFFLVVVSSCESTSTCLYLGVSSCIRCYTDLCVLLSSFCTSEGIFGH